MRHQNEFPKLTHSGIESESSSQGLNIVLVGRLSIIIIVKNSKNCQ